MITNKNADLRGVGKEELSIENNYNINASIAEEFRAAMRAVGIPFYGEIVPDGRLHRFHVDGHRRGTLNGAYILHIDGCPAGWFMNFKTGISKTWSSGGGWGRVSGDMKKQIREAQRQRDAEQRQKHEAAAAKAVHIWRSSKPAVSHPYLQEKRINTYGTRTYGDVLVAPIRNESGRLVNLQFIDSKGNKRFLSGGRKRGCFSVIGDISDKLLICEGFATGASLHEDTGYRIIVAFDAGNLLPVAKNIKDLAPPDSEIIICGDNDFSGIGQEKANEAALAIGGKVLTPKIPGKDWNDVLAGGGNA